MDKALALDSIADDDMQTLLDYGDNLIKQEKERINEALYKVVDQIIGEEKGFKCEANW